MQYSPFTDYDKHGALKVPFTFYIGLVFLLRSFVVWVVALSYRQDSGGLLSLFYPSKSEFTMALIIALPSLIVAVVASLRRVGMGWFIQGLWRNVRGFMALAATVQLGYAVYLGHLSLHNLEHVLVTYPIIIEMIGLVGVLFYCALNRRFKDVSTQFPQAEEES